MSISRHDAARILAEVDPAERLEAVEPLAELASPIVELHDAWVRCVADGKAMKPAR